MADDPPCRRGQGDDALPVTFLLPRGASSPTSHLRFTSAKCSWLQTALELLGLLETVPRPGRSRLTPRETARARTERGQEVKMALCLSEGPQLQEITWPCSFEKAPEAFPVNGEQCQHTCKHLSVPLSQYQQ
ncbi:hypothetical protein SKAU_G00313950 [Synaphobranchus kaupii]|uniref:Uncharacterized protein n=1 Tax=Synaphobranchus kaupii TaxID=118154 RepID=A0A9Q1IKK1_SYNKA|nr:hypothetical protein SKAU_G00313950 [Synaphobranchus kaupii]